VVPESGDALVSRSPIDHKSQGEPAPKDLFVSLRKPAATSFPELFERLGLTGFMRPEAFDAKRAYQLGPTEDLCTLSRSSFLLADTGTGKTVVGAVEVGRILKMGCVALVVTPEEHLLEQWKKVLLRTLHIGESDIFLCSGETLSKRKASAMLSGAVRIIIATPEALTRDIGASSSRIDLSRVGRAILDEADLIEGKSDYAKLNRQLVERGVKRTLMSATVASGYKKSLQKLAELGITIGDLVVMRGRKGNLYDRTFRLDLPKDMLHPATMILQSYRHCLLEMRTIVKRHCPSSFGGAQSVGHRVFAQLLEAHPLENVPMGEPQSRRETHPSPDSIEVRDYWAAHAEPPSRKTMKELFEYISKASSGAIRQTSHYSEASKDWRMLVSRAAELQHLGQLYHLITTSKVAFIDAAARHYGDTVAPIPRKHLRFASRCFVFCREELAALLEKEGDHGKRIAKELRDASPFYLRIQALPSPHKLRNLNEEVDYLCAEKVERGESGADLSMIRVLQQELNSWCIAYQRMVGLPMYDQDRKYVGWQGSRLNIAAAGLLPENIRRRTEQVLQKYKTGVSTKGGHRKIDLEEEEVRQFKVRIYRDDPKVREAIRAVAWGLDAPYDKQNPPARTDPLYYSSLFKHRAWKATSMDHPQEYGDGNRDFILDPRIVRQRFLEDALFDTAVRPLTRYIDSPKDAALHGLPIDGHKILWHNKFGTHLLRGARCFAYVASPTLARFQATRIEALHQQVLQGEKYPEVEASLLLGKMALSPRLRREHLARFARETAGVRKAILTNKTRGTDIANVDEALMYGPLADIRSLHQFRGRTRASRSMEQSAFEEVKITGIVHRGTPEERSLDMAQRRYRAMLNGLERLRLESEAARA
jgi:hypothetical protein